MILDLLQIEIPEDKKVEIMEKLLEIYHGGEEIAASRLLLKAGENDTAEEIAKEIVEIKKKILDIL